MEFKTMSSKRTIRLMSRTSSSNPFSQPLRDENENAHTVFLKYAWEKSIGRALHLHASVEAFRDRQIESLCNASTEASQARSRCAGPYRYFLIGGNEGCTTLRSISLRVGNDDFATAKKTRIE
jgi:hypothetical protein